MAQYNNLSGKLIQLQRVSKKYYPGKVPVIALDDVSINVEPGTMIVVAGPSGSGKSTLLNILGCIDKPDTGRVIVDGIDTIPLPLEDLANFRLKEIGFIFQTFNLIPVLTAYENVEFPLLFRKIHADERKQLVQDAFKDVGLEDRMYHYPLELSGGQQQRVSIARALAGRPNIILADEPTANLDSQTGKEIIRILLDLNQQRNVTIILASHDQEVINRIGRVLQLRDGTIVSGKETRPVTVNVSNL